jgi:hypothetical protein
VGKAASVGFNQFLSPPVDGISLQRQPNSFKSVGKYPLVPMGNMGQHMAHQIGFASLPGNTGKVSPNGGD